MGPKGHARLNIFTRIRECPYCHSTDIVLDVRRGEVYCKACGMVIM